MEIGLPGGWPSVIYKRLSFSLSYLSLSHSRRARVLYLQSTFAITASASYAFTRVFCCSLFPPSELLKWEAQMTFPNSVSFFLPTCRCQRTRTSGLLQKGLAVRSVDEETKSHYRKGFFAKELPLVCCSRVGQTGLEPVTARLSSVSSTN